MDEVMRKPQRRPAKKHKHKHTHLYHNTPMLEYTNGACLFLSTCRSFAQHQTNFSTMTVCSRSSARAVISGIPR
ncbi:unnamed protein product [Ixodes hexagonus]